MLKNLWCEIYIFLILLNVDLFQLQIVFSQSSSQNPNLALYFVDPLSFSITCFDSSRPGQGNGRPAGHIQPAKHTNVAHKLHLKFSK